MEIRYYLDPDSGEPHIYEHGVNEREVEQVLRGSGEDIPAERGSRMKLGQTAAGRYLQVIYVPDETRTVCSSSPLTNFTARRSKLSVDAKGESRDEYAELSARVG